MKRLRDETSSDFLKSVLDSAADDVPPPGAEERALRAAEQLVVVPKGWPRGWLIGGTIVGVGALLLLLGQVIPRAHPAPTPTVEPSATASSTAIVEPPPSATTPLVVPSASVQVPASGASPATASIHPPSVHPTVPVAAPSASVSAPLGLRDELALIDEARTELAGGSAGSALATLGRYDARYPQGLLREEATAVRVEALFASGKTAEARSTGEAFLREHPQSTHAQHVRSLLDGHAP